MKKQTRPTYGNCLFGAMYLCLRRRVNKVVFVSAHHPFVPAHIVCKMKSGHVIHFLYTFHQNPLYFVGKFQGIRRSRINQELAKEDRKIILDMRPNWFFPLGIFLFVILIVPWTIYWPMEAVGRMIIDFIKIVGRAR